MHQVTTLVQTPYLDLRGILLREKRGRKGYGRGREENDRGEEGTGRQSNGKRREGEGGKREERGKLSPSDVFVWPRPCDF